LLFIVALLGEMLVERDQDKVMTLDLDMSDFELRHLSFPFFGIVSTPAQGVHRPSPSPKDNRMTLASLTAANANRWAHAKFTRASEFMPVAQRLCAAKERYQGIASQTGVPWFVIAVIHEREASQRFDRQLGQGDALNRVSIHDPKGRGPFATFEAGALDALVKCGPYAARWSDWTAGGAMSLLEQYNGTGYAMKGLPSPYVWSGTDQYRSGKYIRDHVFDPNVVDAQLGCAGLVLAMEAIDPSIQFGKPTGAVAITPPGKPNLAVAPAAPRQTTPSISNPAAGSVGAKITGWLSGLFKHSA
jgi:lysozyme family protein